MTASDATAPAYPESLVLARLAIMGVIGLNIGLASLFAGPNWILTGLEVLLLLPLTLLRGRERHHLIHLGHRPLDLTRAVQRLSLLTLGLLLVTNLYSLSELSAALLQGHAVSALSLLAGALSIWVTNVLIFSLWYWEMDQGGPLARGEPGETVDFLFPQSTLPPSRWPVGGLNILTICTWPIPTPQPLAPQTPCP
ncbi:hypothetical protein ACFP81_12195 [Deinococcus lacus]|uniref:Uncharacterized protein n=1 Tax=Deinococcus lacus TaxID=392561 RepID=A0ABW1YEB1_9DEIO